jgi:dipeptidyl aminopeptidase/acylaminoacyl peptidase
MVKITTAPYGTWVSPIDAGVVAAAGGGPSWVDTHGGRVWWAEGRPAEGGRLALMVTRPGEPAREVLPAPWNVRNRVHEYGGRPWTVISTTADIADGERVVFTHWDDQRLYLADSEGSAPPVPISPAPRRRHGYRYGDLVAGPDGAEVWCVRETVTGDLPTDVRRDLVAVPLDGRAATDPDAVRVLAASHHFLTGPRRGPDGRRVAWIGWNHPAMPWDGTELCVADVHADGRLGPHRVVAGGPAEAVCQIEWDGPDTLLALTDPDGWWNLHRIDLASGTTRNLAPAEQELGGPMWRLGSRWFVPLGAGRHAVLRSGRLAVLDEAASSITDVAAAADLPVWADVAAVGPLAVGLAAGPAHERSVIGWDSDTDALVEVTEQPGWLPDPAYLPVPVERIFTDERGRPVPAYVYPPTNPEFAGPDGASPPYLVHVHGGPTGASAPRLDLGIAYFTSLGIGVIAVNYGGSTGYGREFRERLRGQWGVVDVRDCASAVRALAKEGGADPARLAIRGGSAGGWTSAASLTSVDVYRCGTVMFPILDLTGWTAEGGQTHDFESRYVESLVGPLPESAELYRQRSPSQHADRLAGPVLMLQGLEDQICPPVQANEFMAALDGSGIPHAYLTFEGEQHGFRKADTIRAALEAELSFYGQVFGFATPGVPALELRH